MTDLIENENEHNLPAMVSEAARKLAQAKTSAEILEVRDMAGVAYDAAKKAARMQKAKSAHDDVIGACHRAQADALEIESMAKRRLADEYDAAQERGEIKTRSDQNLLPDGKKVSAKDIGFTHKQIYEARQIRDAEETDPGIVRRSLDEKLDAGEEPSKAALRRDILETIKRDSKPQKGRKYKNPHKVESSIEAQNWDKIRGLCREIRIWATDENFELAKAGMLEKKAGPEDVFAVHLNCFNGVFEIMEKIKDMINDCE